MPNANDPAPHVITAEDVVSYRFPRDAELSPDGRYAAYVYRASCEDGTPVSEATIASEIWLADIAAGSSHRLTFGARSDHTRRWSPDGKLAFLSDRIEAG